MLLFSCCFQEPQMKKTKLEEEISSSRINSTYLKATDIRIDAVLSEEVLEPSLVQLVAVEVKEKRNISKVVQQISKHFPTPKLLHLKRVKKILQEGKDLYCIFVDSAAKFDINKAEQLESNMYPLNDKMLKFVWGRLEERSIDTTLFSKAFLAWASSSPPRIRKIFERVNKLWPCTFHEDIHLKKLTSNCAFNQEETSNIIRFMNKALEIARNVSACSGIQVGALIVKGTQFENSTMFPGKDQRLINPLFHATMIAIDAVAKSQGGGALSDLCHFPRVSLNEKDSEKDVKMQDYICSGYDAYVTHEPCLMCAMALLHSRVSRVFYFHENPTRGALSSLLKLHTLPGINHRYEVFSLKYQQ